MGGAYGQTDSVCAHGPHVRWGFVCGPLSGSCLCTSPNAAPSWQVFTTEPLKKDSVCPQQHFKQETGCATCALYADKHGLHCAECERDPSLWAIKGTYWGKVYADAYKSRAGGGDLFNPGAARTLNFGALQKQRKPVLPAWAKVGQYLRRNPVTAPPSNARGLVGLGVPNPKP